MIYYYYVEVIMGLLKFNYSKLLLASEHGEAIVSCRSPVFIVQDPHIRKLKKNG